MYLATYLIRLFTMYQPTLDYIRISAWVRSAYIAKSCFCICHQASTANFWALVFRLFHATGIAFVLKQKSMRRLLFEGSFFFHQLLMVWPRSAALFDAQGFKPGETLMIGRCNRSVDSFRRKQWTTEGWKIQILFPSDCVSLKNMIVTADPKVMRH